MKILVISPLASPPATNGAKRRIANLLGYLQNQGHEIHYVYTQHETIDATHAENSMAAAWSSAQLAPPTAVRAPSLGEDYGVDDWTEDFVGQRIGQIAQDIRPDVALVNYVFQSRYFEYLPTGILKVLDTHDKLSRADLYKSAGMTPGFFHTTEEEELRGLERADVILAIQDGEAQYFRRSGKPVVIVGDVCAKRFVDRNYESTRTIGFLSAYNKFNLYSLQKFLPAFLRVAERLSEPVQLHLAGNLARGARKDFPVEWFDNPFVIDEGFVDDIDDFYQRMDLVVNPTLIGTGLKIKTMEALSYGVPLISTRIGFDGIPTLHPWHEVGDENDLARAIEEVATTRGSELTKLSNISRSIFTEYQLNLRHNIDAVFSTELVERNHAGYDVESWLKDRQVGPLADRSSDTYRTVYDASRRSYSFSIAHIINPVALPEGSDLYLAQPITFESMRRARAFAAEELQVELHAVGYLEDAGIFPSGFVSDDGLSRSVLDVSCFSVPRKLPLLTDLLNHVHDHSDADYLVYTNADIGLLPHFYTYVAEKIATGYDAFVINRRTVSKRYADVRDLDIVYADYGLNHPGYDCFVFHRRLLEPMRLGNVCIGVHLVGRVLLWNLMATAKRFGIFTEEHVTFHVGDDNVSKDIRQLDFIRHNTLEALDVLEQLESDHALLTRLRNQGATQLINLDFGRAMLRKAVDPDTGVTLYHEVANRPIFLHALFRTGSTYLWQKLRRSARVVTYYEPLHEELAYFSRDDLEVHKSRHSPGRFHGTNSDDWFFHEYEGLIPDIGKGVVGYDRQFAYDQFADNADNVELSAYIDRLLTHAAPRLPILQFNRTAMRQEWFKRNYPDIKHIYLLRDHVSQWASYTRFYTPGRRGFSRNDAIIAGKNRAQPLFRPLERLVPLIEYENPYDFFNYYDLVFDQYDWEERYTIFYYIWLVSLIEGCRHSDLIIDMNRLSSDPVYKLRIAFEFLCSDIPVDLEDASITDREPNPDLIAPSAMRIVETRVQALIAASFGPMAMTALKSRGYEALAEALNKAGREADRILSDAPLEIAVDQRRQRIAETADGTQTKTRSAHMDHDESASFYPAILAGENNQQRHGEAITLVGGWSWEEGGHRWMESKDAGLRFLMTECATLPALRLQLKTHETLAARNPSVAIFCNGEPVYDGPISREIRTFTIMLHDRAKPLDEVHVQIRSSDVCPPSSYDDRFLSVCLAGAWVGDLLDLEGSDDLQPCDGPLIDLATCADNALAGDWSWPEDSFRWTNGSAAALRVSPEALEHATHVRILAHMHAQVAAQSQPVEIWLEDRKLMSKSIKEYPEWYVATIPDALLTPDRPLTLTITTPSQSIPDGHETRALGVAIHSIEFLGDHPTSYTLTDTQPCEQTRIDLATLPCEALAGEWSCPEEGFRWITGHSAALRLAPAVFRKARRIRIRMHVHPELAQHEVPVELWVADQRLLAKPMTSTPTWYEARLPQELRHSMVPLSVTLVSRSVSTPSSSERRRLSAAVWSIELR